MLLFSSVAVYLLKGHKIEVISWKQIQMKQYETNKKPNSRKRIKIHTFFCELCGWCSSTIKKKLNKKQQLRSHIP